MCAVHPVHKEVKTKGLHSALACDTHRTKSRQTASSGNNKRANLSSKTPTPNAQLSWGATAPGKFSVLLRLASLGGSAGRLHLSVSFLGFGLLGKG